MKKLSHLAFLFLTIGIFVTSCKKDDKITAPEKGNFISAIDSTTFDIVSSGVLSPSNYGLLFSVSKNGKATELGCSLPIAGTYTVTLWDTSANRTILIQRDVTITAGGKNYVSIPSQTLSTGKIYLLTVDATSFYRATPKIGGNVVYPITKGSINILGYRYVNGSSASEFPTTAPTTYIGAFVDLTFQEDN